MEILRVLNNNAVLSRSGRNIVLLMGLSIGYHKRPGDPVDIRQVEKQFVLANPESWNRVQQTLMDIPEEFLLFSGEMVTYAEQALGKPLNSSLYITLTDHIYASYERSLRGIFVRNELLWDIRRIYSTEFAVALEIARRAGERFRMPFGEDEAAFITFHLVNAQSDAQTPAVQEITRLIQDALRIVREKTGIDSSGNDLFYNRLITHLQFFARRALSDEESTEDGNAELLPLIREKYPEAYRCAVAIGEMVEQKYHYRATQFDIMCISIHIATLMKKADTEVL